MLLASAAIAQPTAPSPPIKPAQSPVVPGKAAPSQPPVSARQGGPKDFLGSTNPDRLMGSAGSDTFVVPPNSATGTAGARTSGAGKDTVDYQRRPNPSTQPITPAPSPAAQGGQQGKR